MEVCEYSLLCGMDEVLHPVLQPPPLELDGHQLVGSHHRVHTLLKISRIKNKKNFIM